MTSAAFLKISIFLLILSDLEALTVVRRQPDRHSEDEYVLDHEVSYKEAIAEAKKLENFSGPVPGCKPCTNSEMTYCMNGNVIGDHCCCEGSNNKVFPFVQHTCRVGPEECEVQAGDCAEYTRLRQCCCHAYLAAIWKDLASTATANFQGHFSTKLLISIMGLKLFLHPLNRLLF
ncbi:uncharacterized protein [Prorops nasuta]|uniref:uncharacterized protein n=1 Tax=Prorops nasuta TaxID=863751 RepID=UPI0034CFD40E